MMLLQEQMLQSGQWMFRWRSYLPLLLMLLVALALPGYQYPFESVLYHHFWVAGCLAISAIGLLIRAYTVGHVPGLTSGRNTIQHVAATLNNTGIYSITRNPLYLGNFFMYLGFMAYVRNPWVILAYVLLFFIYYERIILSEEVYLKKRFQQLYEAYASVTPAFLPNPRLWQANRLPFSLRTVLKREYSGLFGLVVGFFLLETATGYLIEGRIMPRYPWLVALAMALLIYLLLRTLKKHTSLLHVEGR